MFKFKECRERANLTQKEAAFSLGVSIQSISNWENDVRRPSLEQLVKIAELYKVTADELLGRVPVAVTIKKEAPPAEPPEGTKRMVLDFGSSTTDQDDIERLVVEIVKREFEKKGL